MPCRLATRRALLQMSRRLVEYTPVDRYQAPILYVLAAIAGLGSLAAVLFVARTCR